MLLVRGAGQLRPHAAAGRACPSVAPARPHNGMPSAPNASHQLHLRATVARVVVAAAGVSAPDAHEQQTMLQPTNEQQPATVDLNVEAGADQAVRKEVEDEVDFETPDAVHSFAELGVDRLFVSALAASGIMEPSPIQEAAIPVILNGANCALQSYTGSGKTLAYLLPAMTLALQRAEAAHRAGGDASRTVQLLIVAPSQELCMQILRVAQGLLPQPARKAVQQCIGGAAMWRQQEALAAYKPIAVVGTPGRLAQLVRAGDLRLHNCPLLVLDEADQLLAPHFTEDLTHICQHAGKRLPAQASGVDASGSDNSSSGGSNNGSKDGIEHGTADAAEAQEGGGEQRHEGAAAAAAVQQPVRQVVLVSATLSQSVLSQFQKWAPEFEFVTSGGAPHVVNGGATSAIADAGARAPSWGWGVKGWDGLASALAPRTESSAGGAEGADLAPTLPPNLQHLFVLCRAEHRVDALRRCVHALGVQRALVFMNWQQRLQDTQHKLAARGMEVACMHGEMPKSARQAALRDFSAGRQRALVVSDVAARGLDIPDVDAVFNLELPSNAAHYAHRAGRTGRMDAPGVVVSLATPRERFVMERLAARLGAPILEAHLQGGELIVGPPPRPDAIKRRKPKATPAATDMGAGNAAAAIALQASSSGRGGSSSSSSSSSRERSAAVAVASKAHVGGGGRRGESSSTRPSRAPKCNAPDEEDAYDSDDEGYEPSFSGRSHKGAARSGGSSSSGSSGKRQKSVLSDKLRAELQEELEEIKGEKAAMRVATRQQRESAGSGGGERGGSGKGRKGRAGAGVRDRDSGRGVTARARVPATR